jgi:long-chain acyl-CoA synthetase
VPRLYNKIYAKVTSGFAALTGCKKWLADRGVASKNYYLNKDASYNHGCYDSLIFGKVAKLMGGDVRCMITASAPISKEVLDLMKIAFCCPVLEAYGLSETLGACNITMAEDPISGTVGGPALTYSLKLKDLPEMNYCLDDKPFPRGEILVGGPCMFRGYFNNPQKTQEMLDEDGFVHTGDVGVMYPNGTVKILDRSKNIFKLAQGEYLAPEKLENIFIQSDHISQCLVYGDSLKAFAVAIVVIEAGAIKAWADKNSTTVEEIISTQNATYKKIVTDSIAALHKER